MLWVLFGDLGWGLVVCCLSASLALLLGSYHCGRYLGVQMISGYMHAEI